MDYKKTGTAGILFVLLLGMVGTVAMSDDGTIVEPPANTKDWFELRYSVILEAEKKIVELNSDLMRFNSENGPVTTWNAEQFTEYDLLQKDRDNHISVYYDLVAEYNNASSYADADMFSEELPSHVEDRLWD